MSFEYSLAALLSLPLLAALFGTLRLRPLRSVKDGVAATLRLSTIVASTLALMQPVTTEVAPAEGLIALVDLSASITDKQGEALLAQAKKLADITKSPLKIIPFAEKALSPTNASGSYKVLRSQKYSLDQSATNIGSALAALSEERYSAALLLSDGYESKGQALTALASVSKAPIFPITSDGSADAQGISISQLYAPLVVKSQQRAEIRVTLSNPLSTSSNGDLVITHGSTPILSQKASLQPNQDATFSAVSAPNLEGLNTITATYTWTDASGSHSISRSTWLSSEKRDKVLLLSGKSEDDRYLSQILKGQAYQLRSEIIGTASALDLGAPADYRTVILNNVAFNSMPAKFAEALASFVRSGGGLITIGGDRSYGLGGYIGSSIETILPVRLVPPHVEKKRLNVAVQLVIDKSRSMAMDSRLEFAKGAAREVLNSLKDDDYIGVIGFDDVPFVALPIAAVGAVRSTAVDRISRLFPTKKTNLFPALDEARRSMSRVNAGRKHVIVLTDGKLPDPGPYYFNLVKQMRVLGITLSTVVVGNDADDGFLAQLSEIGGGSFYQTADPRNLPKIFLSDVKVASDERSLKESSEMIVSKGPSGISSTNTSDFPSLKGFVETLPRDSAKTELIVNDTGRSYPLLASTDVDRGKVISFTSDANGRWSSQWMAWGSINEFWADIVESTVAKKGKARSNINFDLRSWVEGGEVVVDLSIFDDIGGAALSGSLTLPPQAEQNALGGIQSPSEVAPLAFKQISQGHYQSRIPKARPGRYAASISIGDSNLPEVAWEISEETFLEKPHLRPNLQLLQQIAARTGGVINPDQSTLQSKLELVKTKRPLATEFAVLALLFFVMEILVRSWQALRRLV